MKSLNKAEDLWTNMSAKQVEESNYMSSCCFNIHIDQQVRKDQAKSENKESK